MKAKYIRTEQDEIITFPMLMQHSEFASFNPKSAGFISIGRDKEGGLIIDCWGKSWSLGLESHPDDSRTAIRQYKNH